LFMQGNQQYYHIPCKYCGKLIPLKWHLNSGETDTKKEAGITFDLTEGGSLIDESVRYVTQCCGKELFDHDKTLFLKEGTWIASAEPRYDGLVSFQSNSLYSPPGMYSWSDMVYDWLLCWDVEKNRVKDIQKYFTFRNTKQGLPVEEMGEAPRFERVIAHRRTYERNVINNKTITTETGSPLLLVTCACDVQADRIYCDIKGWTERGISYTLDFRELDGDTLKLNGSAWVELMKIIEEEIWTADDGKQYRIRATFIDAGYRTDQVYLFCSQYSSGVYPIFGREGLQDGVTFKEASKSTLEKAGVLVLHLNTTKIKDRIAASFKRDWVTGEPMPDWRPNFPESLKDDFFRMYEAEYKAEKRDKKTNRFLGIYWVQILNADNHAFDTHTYNIGVLELIAETACVQDLGLLSLSWPEFWEYAKKGVYFSGGNKK